MKPLGDVQGNFSYSMKISINNENPKYFSTTQKVQKEVLPARSMELWYYRESRLILKDITLGKLKAGPEDVKADGLYNTIFWADTLSRDSVCKQGLDSVQLLRYLGISPVRKPGCVSSREP